MLFVLYISGTSDAEHRTLKETVLVSLLTCCPEPMFVSDLKVLSTGTYFLTLLCCSGVSSNFVWGGRRGVELAWTSMTLRVERGGKVDQNACVYYIVG